MIFLSVDLARIEGGKLGTEQLAYLPKPDPTHPVLRVGPVKHYNASSGLAWLEPGLLLTS